MKLTKNRLLFFSSWGHDPTKTLTLREIMAGMGMKAQIPRRDYVRIHQFILSLVKQRLVHQNHDPRHGKSTFALTPEGANVAAALRQAYDEKVRKIRTYLEPPPPQITSPQTAMATELEQVSIRTPPSPIQCPSCGLTIKGTEAQAMIRAGQKVRCQCNYNLTALAWAAMEGRGA